MAAGRRGAAAVVAGLAVKVLVCGRGKSGSWQIRGDQLGRAIGATVDPLALDLRGYDLAVVVKRPRADMLRRLHDAQLPIVWDVVDSWPQPSGNEWTRDECMAWLRGQMTDIRPAAIVAATQVMAADCAGFGVPVIALPHHARPGQRINPLREPVQTMGYEGGEQYLGWWRQLLEDECRRRGWAFVVNPPALADLDVVVAIRSAQGYAAKNWKSNVKLANAQGSKTPCIANREAGYLETATAGQTWADNEQEMLCAIDCLSRHDSRHETVRQYAAPQLGNIAKIYREWLWTLKS